MARHTSQKVSKTKRQRVISVVHWMYIMEHLNKRDMAMQILRYYAMLTKSVCLCTIKEFELLTTSRHAANRKLPSRYPRNEKLKLLIRKITKKLRQFKSLKSCKKKKKPLHHILNRKQALLLFNKYGSNTERVIEELIYSY